MRRGMGALAVAAITVVLTGPASAVQSASTGEQSGASGSAISAQGGGTGEFAVFYADGVDAADARAAIAAAGGTVHTEISALGIAQVSTDNAGFSEAVVATGAVKGVVRNHSVGTETEGMAHRFADERALEDRAAYAAEAAAGKDPGGVPNGPKDKKAGPETFSWLQWDMEMIGATSDQAHQEATGDGVVVGIIDTGIDASHPDIAPNFDAELSVNFTTDIPAIDGPCEVVPSCIDPPDVDEGGHGTHVAGTVAAAYNGFGVAGVAPDATLVNLRAGQDSGYFFFLETVSAIVYAAEHGIDVVNMSFYTDPWLYNCETADDYIDPEGGPSADEINEQALIRQGILDAVAYARSNGVTLVAAAGNQHIDLAAEERFDNTSPDYPPGDAVERTVTNNCLDLPSEAPGVIQVAAIGPSTVKADYSTWGLGAIDVAAPGGWFRDYYGTQDFREPENMILSTWPAGVAADEGVLNKGGGLNDPHFYLRDCTDGNDCAYYQYIQGTSMASPHVTGVVALIIQAHGISDGDGGYDLAPDAVYEILTSTATATPCPDPALLDYTQEGRPASWTATCVADSGNPDINSNYGYGIVNAAAAVA